MSNTSFKHYNNSIIFILKMRGVRQWNTNFLMPEIRTCPKIAQPVSETELEVRQIGTRVHYPKYSTPSLFLLDGYCITLATLSWHSENIWIKVLAWSFAWRTAIDLEVTMVDYIAAYKLLLFYKDCLLNSSYEFLRTASR